MKKKIFMILALVMATMTASAVAGYNLTVGKCEHGSVVFKVDGGIVTSAAEGATVTVEITPDQGWTTGYPTGQWYAAVAGAKSLNGTVPGEEIDLLKDFELAAVAGNENAFTFTMERAHAEISVEFCKDFSNPDILVYAVAYTPYTGWPVDPINIVKDGDKELEEDVDYIVTCTNPTEIGPSVATVKGIGKYSGEVTRTFNIIVNKNDLSNALIVANTLYNDIAADYPEIAAELKSFMDIAEEIKANEDATQEGVDVATENLEDAIAEAEQAVREKQWTGITTAQAEGSKVNGSADYYDLQGRRVTQPTKGLYIVNGKKVVIK